MEYARNQITALGYPVTEVKRHTLQFTFRGSPVTLYPYSGWFTGSTVTDGRGIELIRRTVRPVVKECYKNAHLLTLLFPDRVQYVEGKTNVFIPINHAFNGSGTNILTLRLSSHWG